MDEEIYYMDTRNAVDPQGRRIVAAPAGQRIGGQPVSTRTMYIQPQGGVSRAPMGYGQPQVTYGQPQVIYAQPPTNRFGGLFGNLTTGQVIEMVAQIFAVLQPLPAAPVATAVAATDIGNSILYQTALAEYAKRDEQVRTIGSLVGKLVG